MISLKPVRPIPALAPELPPCFITPTGALYLRNPMKPSIYARYESADTYNNRAALPEYVQLKASDVPRYREAVININTLTI